MSLRDDINIPLVCVLGLTTGLIVAVAIIGTQAGYNYAQQAEVARNYEDPNPAVQAQLHYGEHVWAPQRDALAKSASWNDLNKTTVRIPLEDAKRIMIESNGKPPAAPTSQPAR